MSPENPCSFIPELDRERLERVPGWEKTILGRLMHGLFYRLTTIEEYYTLIEEKGEIFEKLAKRTEKINHEVVRCWRGFKENIESAHQEFVEQAPVLRTVVYKVAPNGDDLVPENFDSLKVIAIKNIKRFRPQDFDPLDAEILKWAVGAILEKKPLLEKQDTQVFYGMRDKKNDKIRFLASFRRSFQNPDLVYGVSYRVDDLNSQGTQDLLCYLAQNNQNRELLTQEIIDEKGQKQTISLLVIKGEENFVDSHEEIKSAAQEIKRLKVPIEVKPLIELEVFWQREELMNERMSIIEPMPRFLFNNPLLFKNLPPISLTPRVLISTRVLKEEREESPLTYRSSELFTNEKIGIKPPKEPDAIGVTENFQKQIVIRVMQPQETTLETKSKSARPQETFSDTVFVQEKTFTGGFGNQIDQLNIPIKDYLKKVNQPSLKTIARGLRTESFEHHLPIEENFPQGELLHQSEELLTERGKIYLPKISVAKMPLVKELETNQRETQLVVTRLPEKQEVEVETKPPKTTREKVVFTPQDQGLAAEQEEDIRPEEKVEISVEPPKVVIKPPSKEVIEIQVSQPPKKKVAPEFLLDDFLIEPEKDSYSKAKKVIERIEEVKRQTPLVESPFLAISESPKTHERRLRQSVFNWQILIPKLRLEARKPSMDSNLVEVIRELITVPFPKTPVVNLYEQRENQFPQAIPLHSLSGIYVTNQKTWSDSIPQSQVIFDRRWLPKTVYEAKDTLPIIYQLEEKDYFDNLAKDIIVPLKRKIIKADEYQEVLAIDKLLELDEAFLFVQPKIYFQPFKFLFLSLPN